MLNPVPGTRFESDKWEALRPCVAKELEFRGPVAASPLVQE